MIDLLTENATDWPRYCCAVIQDNEGRFLLERRPPSARFAAGFLTCFGGERQQHETPEQGLRRELIEEIRWSPPVVVPRVRLMVDGRLMAWFFGVEPSPIHRDIAPTPGHVAEWVPALEVFNLDLSPWHRAALTAFLAGDVTAISD